MINTHFVAEDSAQSCSQLGSKSDLGHEIKHLTPCGNFATDQFDVHFGFPARCHTMQQADVVLLPRSLDLLQGRALLLIQGVRQCLWQSLWCLQSGYFCREDLQNFFTPQTIECRGAEVGMLCQALFAQYRIFVVADAL